MSSPTASGSSTTAASSPRARRRRSRRRSAGRASRRSPPTRPSWSRSRGRSERFGAPVPGSPKGASVRLDGGEEALADVVRALDAEGLHLQHLQLHAPTLDDVFLAKTGRSLEGAGDEPSRSPSRSRRRPRREPQPAPPPGRVPRPPLGAANAAAAAQRRAVVRLPADPARGQRGRARVGRPHPGVPDRLVPRLRARLHLHAGRALRDDERRHRSRARHPDRLPRTASRSRRCGARRSCSASSRA